MLQYSLMISGVILAKNEESNLAECIKTLKFCETVLVIDDESTDDTQNIAKKMGAKVVKHSLNSSFGAQRNFALSLVKTPWALFLDADERISPALAAEIISAVKNPSFQGYYLHRIDQMWAKNLQYGDVKGTRLLRLGKTAWGKWAGDVHETWKIIGRTSSLSSPLIHLPHQNLDQFLNEINFYSTLRAQELYRNNEKSSLLSIILYPIGKFVYLYLFKLGFFDGTPGFIHAMTMAFYTFLVRGKLFLLSKNIPPHQ